MLRLVKFINERRGVANISSIEKPKIEFNSIEEVFTDLLNHEVMITNSINEIVYLYLEEKDFTTHNLCNGLCLNKWKKKL